MKKQALLSAFLFTFFAAGAQTYNEAIKLVQNNKTSEAIAQLKQITSKPENSRYAPLVAALIETSNEHYLEGFKHFQKFCNQTDNPYPYIYAFATSGIFTKGESARSPLVTEFFEKLLIDKKAPAIIRAFAAEKLAKQLELAHKIKASKEMYLNLHDVKNWSTVGVFENVSGSGYNKNFGVLEHPEPAHVFINKYGAMVSWFTLPGARNDRWWDFEYNYNTNDALIYAQTFLKSDADKEVLLSIGVSGSMKVWLNDLLIGSESEERNTDQDVYIYKVKLQQGFNRILLQLGSSEILRNNYMVRILDVDGNLIENPESQADYVAYKKAAPYKIEQQPFFAEKHFEDKLAAGDDKFINSLLLLDVYNHNDKKHEAREIAASLKSLHPNSTLVSEKYIEALSRDNNQIDLSKEIEFVKNNDPESLLGLALRIQFAEQQEKWDEALTLLQRRMELYGETEDTELKRLNYMGKRGDVEALRASLKNAAGKYPGSSTFLAIDYMIAKEQSKNLRNVNRMLERFLEDNYDESITEEVVKNYVNMGEKETAVRKYKELIEEKPYATSRYSELANFFYEKSDYAEAMKWQDKTLERAPYTSQFAYAKGLIYESQGKKTEAIDWVKRSIQYDPTNYEARKKLRTLTGKKDLFEYFPTSNIDSIYKASLQKNTGSKDNAIVLLTDKKQIIYPENGAVETSIEALVHVLTATGINDFKEFSLTFNQHTQRYVIEKAEILKSDGSKVTADVNDNQIVFSSLERNDAIYVQYKVQEASAGLLAEHFWHDFSFSSAYPQQQTRYSLILPNNRNITTRAYNLDIQPNITKIDDFKLMVWQKTDIPAVEAEFSMPPTADISERLIVSTIPDWGYVAKWYTDISGTKTKADYEVKQAVQKLFAGKTGLSDLEKAKMIYNFIEHNFHYSSVPFLHSAYTPQRASRTLNAKLGDCKDLSSLFVAMSREAGLNANLVLVATRDNGVNNLLLPSIGFNHCIARLTVGDKHHFIELTNNHLPFGTIDVTLQNAKCLVIPNEGEASSKAELMTLNANTMPANTLSRHAEIALTTDGAAIKRKSYRTGAAASSLRRLYADQDDESRIKDLTSSLADDFNKILRVEHFKVRNLENLNDTVYLDYDVQVKDFTDNLLGMQVFKMPWTDAYFSHTQVSLEKRKYPLDLSYICETPTQSETITVKIPTGKQLVEKPKDVTLSCPEMTYTVTYKSQPGKLVAHRQVKFLKEKVQPESYPEFKKFISRITEEDNRQFAIK